MGLDQVVYFDMEVLCIAVRQVLDMYFHLVLTVYSMDDRRDTWWLYIVQRPLCLAPVDSILGALE